jgi:hypothetical protein
MNHHRLVSNERTVSFIITPDALRPWVSGRASEDAPEHLQGGVDPVRRSVAFDARDEQDDKDAALVSKRLTRRDLAVGFCWAITAYPRFRRTPAVSQWTRKGAIAFGQYSSGRSTVSHCTSAWPVTVVSGRFDRLPHGCEDPITGHLDGRNVRIRRVVPHQERNLSGARARFLSTIAEVPRLVDDHRRQSQ